MTKLYAHQTRPVTLLDMQHQRSYVVSYREAKRLEDKFPSRYIIRRDIRLAPEEKNMPPMPKEYKPLPDGIAVLATQSVRTDTENKYGAQEVVTCAVIKPDGYGEYRVYIPHKSYKKVTAAIEAGIALQTGDSWSVIIGVKFNAVIQNKKVVALARYEADNGAF